MTRPPPLMRMCHELPSTLRPGIWYMIPGAYRPRPLMMRLLCLQCVPQTLPATPLADPPLTLPYLYVSAPPQGMLRHPRSLRMRRPLSMILCRDVAFPSPVQPWTAPLPSLYARCTLTRYFFREGRGY